MKDKARGEKEGDEKKSKSRKNIANEKEEEKKEKIPSYMGGWGSRKSH